MWRARETDIFKQFSDIFRDFIFAKLIIKIRN